MSEILSYIHGGPDPRTPMRPASDEEAAAAIRAFRILIDAAENYGNQTAEDRLVKAAKAIGVKVS
jgi:hypothetical protein